MPNQALEQMMNKDLLIEQLNSISKKTNEEWLAGLNDRKREELSFHDKCRQHGAVKDLPKDIYDKLHGNKKFYRTVDLSTAYVDSWIRAHGAGKMFLDYACGDGMNAIKAAKAGADLAIGVDISRISVQNARNSAKEQGLSNAYFLQGDCEHTGLPDNCIDAAICSGMLHHLDLSYAFYELRRILKPGGVILAVEALDYNPLIKLYRNTTPSMRTEWEATHILSYKDVEFASRFFNIRDIRHWHLFSIAGVIAPRLLPLLNAVDTVILNIPGIKLLSWMFTFELHNKVE